ncbi:MAG: polysaccharide biosynthesis protein [Geothrix sp.]|uniref:polysaccharide biosynthesis protein n=1 Tax=Geothrix sp. TaxID=1962974 RepID=UPI001802FBB2|nr:nucleoside-diphosphate sugar epimerase/dehydratase [Geothrix sp.]NWJ42568.1 polysaccharide biosynthesis protein [Geothrix sp.]WIL19472.1 MAG: polysaccharide biosynthesis protein [Geothrix sp.]
MPPEFRSIQYLLLAWIQRTCSRPWVRQAVKMTLDAGLAGVAWAAAFGLVRAALPDTNSTLAWVAFAMGVNLAFQHTRQHYRLMGFVELRSLILSMLALVLVPPAGHVLDGSIGLGIEPPNLTVAAGLLTALTWVMVRATAVDVFRRRLLRKHPHRPTVDRRKTPRGGPSQHGELALRTLIVGAGHAGAQLCLELQSNAELKSRVVGFVDDALEKQGVRIQGVPVLGHSDLLPVFIKEAQVSQVILAMPRAPGSRIRQLARALHGEGVRVKTLPSIQDFMGKNAWKPELRDIAIDDLLRREPISLDLGSIQQALADSVVLITGAGGSIGGELARQVARFGPARLILLGRGENSLWEIERELHYLYPDQALEVELCDIRNPERLRQVFQAWRPQFVFHAAAHKHVPYLEKHPEEGIENNIFGTLNVLKAAQASGVARFVNVSTDKAVNPTSVLGATKRIAEFLVLQAAEDDEAEGRYVSVRFGNVLGSRGSVIPLFHDQIRRGGPLTITHQEMTRYFMTIPEAAQLVLQAGMLGQNGKVFVLDMGEPVRIVDLAEDMARLSGLKVGYDIDLQFTGMRPGEKLHEELFTDQEQGRSDVHEKVFEASQEPKNRAVLGRWLQTLRHAGTLPEHARQRAILQGFMELVPNYQPSPNGLGRHLDAAIDFGEDLMPSHRSPASVIVLRTPVTFTPLQSS